MILITTNTYLVKENKLFPEIKIYHLALYDIDYTYILGETPDQDYVGIKESRNYEYNP